DRGEGDHDDDSYDAGSGGGFCIWVHKIWACWLWYYGCLALPAAVAARINWNVDGADNGG
ncbi:MAG: hypothetical protein ACO3DK_05930, partial [Bacteroidia bacterium]